jgi:hypothetical protein
MGYSVTSRFSRILQNTSGSDFLWGEIERYFAVLVEEAAKNIRTWPDQRKSIVGLNVS